MMMDDNGEGVKRFKCAGVCGCNFGVAVLAAP